jgi:tetratricopeptide (TPR) repeat protein
LSDALNHFPSNPCLLTERALLFESLDRPTDARSDFENAEKSPSAEYRAQMLLDFGSFLFRRHEWKAAAERMKLLGADSVHNPLFSNYLICLFNQGDFRQSLALAEDAIRQETEFVEDHHAIAARCYHICDNLPRAKEQLDLLVAKGTSRELEHRKLLAWVYWRIDDLPQAYDVLVKCLKVKADDVDSLLLMSAVCSVRGRHEEALENARRATELEPQSVRTHTALVKAAFSCPPDIKLKQKHLDAHFRSLAFLQDSKVGVLQAIPFEPDLHTFLGMVKNRAEEIKQFEEHFTNNPLPIGIFANRIGRSLFESWVALMQHGKLKIRVALGTTEEQQSEIASAMQSQAIAIDLIALLTLHHLKLLALLPRMFSRIFVHSSLFDAVIADLRNIQQHPETGGVSYVDGKYIRYERSAEQNQITVNWLTELRDFLKGTSVELTGLLPETLKTGNAKLIVDVCGLACIAPMYVAREKSVTLFSDDACMRSLGRVECQVSGFSIQAFLRVATHKNLITATEYQDAVIKLIKSNYAFISEDSGILRRCYETDKGRISQLPSFLINRVNDTQYNARSCLALLSEFAIFLWRKKEPDGANTREEWHKEIWLAFSKSANAESLIYEFTAYLAINCATQPAVFFGILNNAMLEIPFINRRRANYFRDMAVAANTMFGLSREGFPYWPKLAEEWLAHKKLNDRLAKLGFFDSRNFDLPAPVKKTGKYSHKRSRKAHLKSKRRFRKKHSKLVPVRPSIFPGAKGTT